MEQPSGAVSTSSESLAFTDAPGGRWPPPGPGKEPGGHLFRSPRPRHRWDGPNITGVTQSDETVNHYNLIIEGRNFQQNSTLMVMEERSYESSGSPTTTVDTKRVTRLVRKCSGKGADFCM